MSDIKCPFSVKLLEKVEIKKGCWKVSKVGIFQDDKQIGEYVRNYESYIEATFCPFLQDGKWYALYSPNYTVTRLMSLPDCKDLGGEEHNTWGFCPTGPRNRSAPACTMPSPTAATSSSNRTLS